MVAILEDTSLFAKYCKIYRCVTERQNSQRKSEISILSDHRPKQHLLQNVSTRLCKTFNSRTFAVWQKSIICHQLLHLMECIFRQHFQTNFLHCPSQLECALLFQIRMILTSVFFVTAMMCSCCGDTFALFTLTGGKKLNMFVLRTIWAGPVKRTLCSWHEGMWLRGPRPLCARKIPWNPVNFPEDDALPLWFVVVVTLIMINTDLVGFIALLWMILLCSLTPNEWILFIEPVAFCSDMSLNNYKYHIDLW